ncbi:MAG TPA: ribosome small subunit-dependent GTPase A [Bryobacteraceae bacterium]|nr:ribosome small subunit-dependent GTPase A [Bryobacteraceae bacterium]
MDLYTIGWCDAYGLEMDAGLRRARVASDKGGVYELWAESGVLQARVAGGWRLARPVTGDWVCYDSGSNVIKALLPRRSKVSRKKAGRTWEEQVLAANVDVLFLVTAFDHDLNLRRMERYLVMAAESGARPVVVLNKADVCADPAEARRGMDRIAGDVEVVPVSALDRESVGELHRYVERGETAALLGSSGVGKSTIVNRLVEREAQPTQVVREHDGRGQHTTTGRQLFLLEEGWLLIDTPGLRELEPWAGAEATTAVFPDIMELAQNCRFRDCAHASEPGCAITAAISGGRLEAARLESFQKLRGEMKVLEEKCNPRKK